jgi:tetratricopeptide (TPR) repeat protein
MLSQEHEYLVRCESYRSGAEDQDLAKYYFSLSIVKQQLSENPFISLYYSEKSLRYQQKVGDPNRLAMVFFARSIQFQLVDQPKDAMKCLQQGMDCFKDHHNVNLKAILEYSIGRIYHVGEDYQQAIKYYMNALLLFRESSFIEKSIQVHKRLVEIYIKEKKWTLVEDHYQLKWESIFITKDPIKSPLYTIIKHTKPKSY